MVTIKTPEEIAILREGGKRLAAILRRLASEAREGVSAADLDKIAHELAVVGVGTDTHGNTLPDKPAFLGYKPESAHTAYKYSICVSINEEIVHGFPVAEKIFKTGDIVSIDMGLIHGGLITDAAVTVVIGDKTAGTSEDDKAARDLVKATEEALARGIAAARAGAHVGAIGHAIESFARPLGFGLAEELAGHGVGYSVHEDPYIPNTGSPKDGPLLKAGMVIAIEPMLTEGGDEVEFDPDGYTVRTADGSRAAHAEHTIVITEDGAEVLTQ